MTVTISGQFFPLSQCSKWQSRPSRLEPPTPTCPGETTRHLMAGSRFIPEAWCGNTGLCGTT